MGYLVTRLQIEDGRHLKIVRHYMLSRQGNTLGQRVQITEGCGAQRTIRTYKVFGMLTGDAETVAIERWLREHPAPEGSR